MTDTLTPKPGLLSADALALLIDKIDSWADWYADKDGGADGELATLLALARANLTLQSQHIAALEARFNDHHAAWKANHAARVAEVLELRLFAEHKPTCAHWDDTAKCTCGLAELMERTKL